MNSTTICQASNKMRIHRALKLYARQSSKLIKRCMILAGFEDHETNEFGHLYMFFMGMSLEYEFERLKILKSHDKYNLEIASAKLKYFSQTRITNIECSPKLEMMKRGMARYRFESCYIMVKCMIKSGFRSSDTEICSSRYKHFLRKALDYEHLRWKYLRFTSRLEKKL